MIPPVGDVVEVGRVKCIVAIVQRTLPTWWTKSLENSLIASKKDRNIFCLRMRTSKRPVFTASGLPKRNSHELINPAICPLRLLPSALNLANPLHCDTGPGQTVEDSLLCESWESQQEKREKRPQERVHFVEPQ